MKRTHPTELLADYTVASRTRPASLTLFRIVEGRREIVREVDVAGRRNARTAADRLGARPWNF